MKKIAAIFLFLISALLVLSEVKAQKIKIYGKVKGNDSLLGGATVTLRSLPDSVLVKGTVTSDSGIYELTDLDTGNYILNIDYLHYRPYFKEIRITENNKSVTEEVVMSRDKSNYLQAVKVVSHKPFITRSVDKTVINIEGSVYSKGENALRLFNVIPGVHIDPLNGIQFRGSQGVTVYVDNRKIQLSGQQLFDYLRSIPSESIKSYEVQAVPGASYDAQNAGTVINITLKNNYKYGLSGSIGTSYKHTRYNEFDENAALNYRVGKINTCRQITHWYCGKQFYDNDELQQYKASNLYNLQNNLWTA
ncbi:MAG: carboxypeptidase regulatory-like domain-containing protein [Segetibacter sp.]